MMGKVAISTKRSHSQPKFATASRFDGQQAMSPGYEPVAMGDSSPDFKYASPVSAIGKQSLSNKSTLPSFSFGSKREGEIHITKVAKVY